ncbi:hypothetical protein EDB19DRAFT_1914691 [Suillus lakei]|nr:hypothetical protein EDB19DRAFT_1914691 [Suillus lakei]
MTASRSYSILLSVLLRLIRRLHVVIGGNERPYREHGLALSSQPIEQDKSTVSVTFAVPLWYQESLDIALTPVTPRQISRYGRNVKIRDESVFVEFEIEKGPLDCSEELAAVARWESLTHPSGALFFYHPYTRVFTDDDVRDPGTAAKINKAAEKLGLRLMEDDGEKIGYYFVDHDRRVIFWFEARKSRDVMWGVRGVERKGHAILVRTTSKPFLPPVMILTGRHIEFFSNKRSLPEKFVVRLKELVIYDQAGSINKEHEHYVHIVARWMRRICMAKFVNFCGQPGARISQSQLLYGDSNTRSKGILFRAMNLVMFKSPDAHSKVTSRVMARCEWSGYIVFSSVMLAVDISFLAVPFVQTQTSAILVSYLSTLCVTGSLVVTLVFARQVNDSQRFSNSGFASFMFGVFSSIERLSLMLSLPSTFLIWGIIFFVVALSIVIFHTSDVVTVSIVYPIWAAIVILATWPALARHIRIPILVLDKIRRSEAVFRV